MNVPKLRFKEFNGEWEEKTFRDIVSLNLVPVEKPNTDYVRLGIRSHCKGTFHELVKIENLLEADKMFLVPKDNLILNITFAWEHAIAITSENDEGKYVSGRFPTFAFKKNEVPAFYESIIRSKRMKYELGVASPGGAGRNRVLNKELFLDIPVKTTGFEEQTRIAEFVKCIDKKIENQKLVAESLENQKKGLMQKIFSQELRFKDDDGKEFPAWEEKKFDSVFEFLPTNTYSREEASFFDGVIQNIHYGDILTKYSSIVDLDRVKLPYLSSEIEYKEEKLEKSKIKDGDIVIADTAEDYTVGKVCEVTNVGQGIVVAGLHTMLCRVTQGVSFASGYLGYYMNSSAYHDQLLPLIVGTKVSSIAKKYLIKTVLQVPCLKEQEKIVGLLLAIDQKVEITKKELEYWQQIKKGLLQQMFV